MNVDKMYNRKQCCLFFIASQQNYIKITYILFTTINCLTLSPVTECNYVYITFNLPFVSSLSLITIMTCLSVSGSGSILRGFVWQLKGIRRNTDNVRCTLCLDEEDVAHMYITGLFRN
jgi:hypothetical protein